MKPGEDSIIEGGNSAESAREVAGARRVFAINQASDGAHESHD